MTAPGSPRPIDHCVLPTAGIRIARRRLERLGFTVAPDGFHPFGTENCCVYFADGTFLEPLAVGDRLIVKEAVRSGNVFVDRDQKYRAEHGAEGFSALGMGTGDAAADEREFRQKNLSGGEMLCFSRAFIDADGNAAEVSFRLAFAVPDSADSFFFTCERVNSPGADKGAMQMHENGVSGIERIVLSAADPAACRPLLEAVIGAEAEEKPFGIEVLAANGTIAVLNPDAFQATYGLEPGEAAGARLRAVILRTDKLFENAHLLMMNGVNFEWRGNHLVVPPAPGQGAALVFEEPA